MANKVAVNDMLVILKSLLLTVILVSCGTTNDSRYRDTQMLERPPVLAIEKRVGEQPIEPDNSSIPKKPETTGLGSKAYLTDTSPPQLKIKQTLSEAWLTVGLALKQASLKHGEIRITDHDREKGLYYVNYSPKSLFEAAASLLKVESEPNEAVYLLKLVDDGAETTITATVANAAEQSGADTEDDDNGPTSQDADALLRQLHEIIRDDLTEQ